MVAVAIATECVLQASACFFKLLWTDNVYLRRSGSMASGSGDRLLFGLPYVGSLVSGAVVDVLLHDEEFFVSAVVFYYFLASVDGEGVLLLESSCRVDNRFPSFVLNVLFTAVCLYKFLENPRFRHVRLGRRFLGLALAWTR